MKLPERHRACQRTQGWEQRCHLARSNLGGGATWPGECFLKAALGTDETSGAGEGGGR